MSVAKSQYQFRTAAGGNATLTFTDGEGLQVHIDGQEVYKFPEQFIHDAFTVVNDGVEGLVDRIDAVGAVTTGTERDAMLDFIDTWGRGHY